MGNSCKSLYRDSSYSIIEEDGTPYYKPRNTDSRIMSSSITAENDFDCFGEQDNKWGMHRFAR